MSGSGAYDVGHHPVSTWTTQLPTALVVDPDASSAWWRDEPLRSLVRVVHLPELEQAPVLLTRTPPPAGLVLATPTQIRLRSAIERTLRLQPALPILVVARDATLTESARVFRMGGSYLPRPDSPRQLARDVALFLSRRMLPEDRRRVALEVFCEHHGISQRGAELVGLVAAGYGRKELASEMGVSENSVKSHVRNLIRRTGCMNLECLLSRLDDFAAQHIDRLLDRTTDASGRHRLRSEYPSRGSSDAGDVRDSGEWSS